MKPFVAFLAICCTSLVVARPGYKIGGNAPGGPLTLTGIPGISAYGDLSYPSPGLLDLGSSSHGSVPPTIVQITKHETLKIPQPYPIKVPHPVPYPVPIAKPYPVVETKLIKVPQPFPVEVIKKVPVPIEVPKPYPVPSGELKTNGLDASIGGYGSSFGGSLGYDQHLAAPADGGYQEGGFQGYDGGHGSYGAADQSAGYGAIAEAQQQGQDWAGGEAAQGVAPEQTQAEEEQH